MKGGDRAMEKVYRLSYFAKIKRDLTDTDMKMLEIAYEKERQSYNGKKYWKDLSNKERSHWIIYYFAKLSTENIEYTEKYYHWDQIR